MKRFKTIKEAYESGELKQGSIVLSASLKQAYWPKKLSLLLLDDASFGVVTHRVITENIYVSYFICREPEKLECVETAKPIDDFWSTYVISPEYLHGVS